MKKINAIILAGILFFALTSCGGNEKTDEEKAAELTESIIKNVTGNDVDIDVDEDGETGSVTIKGENGEEITFGSNEELPDDLPSDVYIIKGEMQGVGNISSDKGQVVTFSIKTDKDISDLKKEIEKEMESNDWKSGMNMSVPEGAMLNYTKDEKGVTITIGEEKEETIVTYMVSYKK